MSVPPIPDVPINVPIDDPNADTEWNDILRQHGIIPEKPPSPTSIIEEAIAAAQQRAHENRLEGKDLDELDEFEDDEDEEFLNIYRQKRMAELQAQQRAARFGAVYAVQKAEYAREVTEVSAGVNTFVLVLLASSSSANIESNLLAHLWRELAPKYPEIKFCQIPAHLCIEGYPQRNCPTVLVYRDGDIVRQFVTAAELGGTGVDIERFERVLVDVGAVKSADLRLRRKADPDADADAKMKSIRSENASKRAGMDDDDDWD